MKDLIKPIIIGLFIAYVTNAYSLLPVFVPDVTNRYINDAKSILLEKGISYEEIIEEGPTKGLVKRQTPAPNTMKIFNKKVLLVYESGPAVDSAKTPQSLTPQSLNQTSHIRRAIIPSGTVVSVVLLKAIHVEGQSPPEFFQAALAKPLQIGTVIIADNGAPITLNTSASLDGQSTTLRISTREAKQIDGRFLPILTNNIEFTSSVTSTNIVSFLITITIVGGIIGAVMATIAIPPLGCLVMIIGLVAIGLFSCTIQNAKIVDLPAGKVLDFKVSTPTIAEIYN